MKNNRQKKRKLHGSLIGALAAAVAASICCLVPLILVTMGIGGAWIGNLKALSPFRPGFMLIALGFLAFGFYKAYRKPKIGKACEEGSYCATPYAGMINKIVLWLALVFIIGLFVYPTIAARLVCCTPPTNQPLGSNQNVVLNVEGMTCDGCRATVTTALRKLDGVIDVQVTLDPPQAVVRFDPAQIQISNLTHATANAGYSSSPQTGVNP